MTRTFSPYEKNHLRRFGKPEVTPKSIGEKPVEYVTGKVEFYDRVFTVSPDVMIPRIETEELIDIVLHKINEELPQPNISIVDVGTGSGVIGITLGIELASRKNIDLTLVDISPDALEIARNNVSTLCKSAPQLTCNIIQSNLLSMVPKSTKFDVVIANLPYIPSERIPALDASVKDFEPHLALDGGPDGLTLIRSLVAQLPTFLNPSGFGVFEIDYTHTIPEIIGTNTQVSGVIQRDQFNRHRFAVLRLV